MEKLDQIIITSNSSLNNDKDNHSSKSICFLFYTILAVLIIALFGAVSHQQYRLISSASSPSSQKCQLISDPNYSLQNSSQITYEISLDSPNSYPSSSQVSYDVNMCNSSTIMDKLCKSSDVAMFRIIANDTTINKSVHQYSINLIKLLKSSSPFRLRNSLNRQTIFKVNSSDVELIVGRTYLTTIKLDSKLAIITKCDLILEWSSISGRIKNSISRLFEKPIICLLNDYNR